MLLRRLDIAYANHRPSYSAKQVENVWTATRDAIKDRMEFGNLRELPKFENDRQMYVRARDDATGKDVFETSKGQKWRLIEWAPGESRLGVWDMGHVPKQKYSTWHDDYMRGKMTTEEFVRKFQTEEYYQAEDPSRNRSHDDE